MPSPQMMLPPDLAAEQQAIERRRRLMEALLGPGMQGSQGQMAGNVYVPPHRLEPLTRALSAFAMAKAGERDDASMRGLGQQATDRRSQALARALGMMQGQTAMPDTSQEGTGSFDMSGTPGPQPVQTVAPNPQAAMQALLGSGDPMLSQLGMQGMTAQMAPKNVVVGRSIMNPQTGQVVGSDPTVARENDANRESREFLAAQAARDREALQAQAAADRQALVQAQQGSARVPPGYRQTRDGNLEAIPGGPADQKIQGQLNQDTATLTNTEGALDRLSVAANELLHHPGIGRITGLAGALPNVPGMAGADAQAKLQTLKAQVGFGVLQEMRNASRTGGALGQVTEKELGFLQNALAALDNAQSEDQFKESLQKVLDYAAAAKARLRGAYNMKHQGRVPAGGGQQSPSGWSITPVSQ